MHHRGMGTRRYEEWRPFSPSTPGPQTFISNLIYMLLSYVLVDTEVWPFSVFSETGVSKSATQSFFTFLQTVL